MRAPVLFVLGLMLLYLDHLVRAGVKIKNLNYSQAEVERIVSAQLERSMPDDSRSE